MSAKTIYFDNAASSFPKPEAVIRATADFLRTCGNPGRGAHGFALDGARRIFEAREKVAEFLGVKQAERLVFTPGCTASLNMALKGFAAAGGLRQGDVVVVSSFEHNSMMRPLTQLKESIGISHVVCPVTENFETELQQLVELHKPKLVALNWASNVTGEVLPIRSIARSLEDKQIPLLVDAAQTAGKLDADLDNSGISFFCASGHKGLMGAPGVGVLYVAPGVPIAPLISGGTGSRSESLQVPEEFPDRLEAGTLPGPAIVALAAGVHWLKAEGVSTSLNAELYLADRFLSWAQSTDYIKVFGAGRGGGQHSAGLEGGRDSAGRGGGQDDAGHGGGRDGAGRGGGRDGADRGGGGGGGQDDAVTRMPVVSFSMNGISPSSLADRLDTEYGIAVRAGLHCAPLCHEQLGTIKEGLVRASFGVFNTGNEVDAMISALKKIQMTL